MNTKSNFETRISNRGKSIFAAFGTIINDFYLEAGIYFVGGFNASLVAWGIYTDLLIANQPLPYAVAVAVVAFVAVEGLAVYLVGAAAKTNSGLLWFFSVVFAAFFTYAHLQEMARPGIISQYITLAIPFFVVIGYYAKTVKVDTENSNDHKDIAAKDELARKRQLADEELAHKRETERLNAAHQKEIEQDRLNAEHQKEMDQHAADLKADEHQRHMDQQAAELKHSLALAKIEANKAGSDNRQVAGKLPEETKPAGNLPEWLPMMPESLSHFRHLVSNGSVTLPAGLSGADLGRAIGRSPRTGQNWLAEVQNGNGVTK